MSIDSQRTNSGKLRAFLPDAVSAIIEPHGAQFTWTLTFPNGKSETGTATTEAAAQEACAVPYREWIVRQWTRGRQTRDGYLCPLQ